MRLTRTATLLFASLALPATLTALPAMAQTTGSLMSSEHTVMVGGAPMYPSKNIVQNAVNSKDHTTLVAAVKAAGLVDTLEGPGPFTVFAPTKRVRSHVRPSLSVVTASIFNTVWWSRVIMPSSTGLKAVEQMDGGCTSSAAVLRLSAYCTTSESECAVPGVPRNSMLSSSSCTGSANWSVLGVSPRQIGWWDWD
jgi:hypothetical protein